jgi:hypothetical protein
MLLIDGDIVAYRVSYTTADASEPIINTTVDNYLTDLIAKAYAAVNSEGDYKIYLTGNNNFRYDVAVSYPYKGNRTTEKPTNLSYIRRYLIDQWDAVLVHNEEADDAIAIAATGNPDTVIVSIDKDFLQVPGTHYNMNNGLVTVVNDVDGLRFFYKQILTGDRVDNIVGIKGIGPKRASALIDGLTTEEEMYKTVVDTYKEHNMDVDRVIENAKLLWLRRYEGQTWEPPSAGQE